MIDLFGVSVKQAGAYVNISGVSFYALARDIQNFYGTSLITKYMIRRGSWNSLQVHNFYLVELHYILTELLKLRTLYSRRRELAELKEMLENETWIKDTVNPKGVPFDFKKLALFNYAPLPKQREFLEHYPIIRDSYHLKGLLLDSVPGSGKAMPYDIKVKVPGGWRELGSLKIGDTVVGPNGNFATITGVHPQGVVDRYRFTFEDGRTADSHALHLWKVFEDGGEEGYVTTTQDILNHFSEHSYSIPLIGKIDGGTDDRSLDIDRVAKELITLPDSFHPRFLELSYNERFAIVKSVIRQANTYKCHRWLEVYIADDQASKNFQQLVWSIGGIAFNGGCEFTHCVRIDHPDMKDLLKGLIWANLNHYNTTPKTTLEIVAIDLLEPVEMLCISIDSDDHLYVVDDYIVTHNTYTSLVWSQMVNTNKTIILCPLNIVDEVWMKQINLHFKTPPKVWSSKMGRLLTPDYDYYIVHYQYLQGSGYEYLRKFLEDTVKSTKQKFNIIIDESHNFNEIKSKQTKHLIELADLELFSDALPMSGTPLKALGSEAYPIIALIDKHFDKKAREFFLGSYGRNRPALISMLNNRIGRGKFTIPELQGLGEPPPFEIVKVKVPNSDKYTLDAIKLEMQTYIADRVAFYAKHMPEFVTFYNETVSRYEESIQTNPKALEELKRYKAIVHRFRTKGYNNFTDSVDSVFCKSVEEDIEKGLRGKELHEFRNVKSAVKYPGLKIRGEALGNVLGKARINAIKDLIAHAELPKYIQNVEKKTVIFTSYVEALQLTDDYLKSQGFHPVTVYGETNNERDRLVKQTAEDPKLNPLIATYASLKEGYPLIWANQLISLNAPFRDYEIKQVQARIHRQGQDTQCFFWMMDLDTGDKTNITTRSIDILAWSKEQVDALLGKLEGHKLLTNVTGEEMLDLSEEPDTRPLKVSNSVLTLF